MEDFFRPYAHQPLAAASTSNDLQLISADKQQAAFV
jgi:hypothetical protein